MDLIPAAQFRLLSLHAIPLAGAVCQKLGYRVSEKRIRQMHREILEAQTPDPKLPTTIDRYAFIYVYILLICTRSYLITQYYHWRNLDMMNVDPKLLGDKYLSVQDKEAKTHSNLYIDKVLSGLLSLMTQFTAEYTIASQSKFNFDPPLTLAALMDEGCESGLWGAICWQVAESLWAGRSTSYRKKTNIFISYAQADRKKVLTFKTTFEKHGYNVWIDEKDILVGAPLMDKISEAIESHANYFVIFLSANSINSEWVKFETRIAHNREMQSGQTFLLPVRLDDCEVPKALKIKKYADAKQKYLRCAEELAVAVGKWELERLLFT